MNFFKKLVITLNSQVDSVADKFENREALSNSYIREYERVAAKTKVKLAQIDAEVLRLEKEVKQQQEQAAVWAARAKKVHSSDENKALECVARMKGVQRREETLRNDLQEAILLRNKMEQDVNRILEKLKELKRKHQNLLGRQVCADAMTSVQQVEGVVQDDINDFFTRWESDVVANELRSHSAEMSEDILVQEFTQEEQQDELRHLLDELINTDTRTEE